MLEEMDLRDIESTLPPGFRFCPSDEELVCHYLYKKVTNHKITQGTMVEVNLLTREPWDLPEVAKLSDNEWYFFSFRDRKYATGFRANRTTRCGYWKATGKDRVIYNPRTDCGVVVGLRKTLVFYQGRAPNAVKTSWVMHEFRLENSQYSPHKDDWVLCRVFHKRKGEIVRAGFENASELEKSGSEMEQLANIPEEYCHRYLAPAIPLSVPHQEGNSSNSYLNLAVLQYDFIDFPQEIKCSTDMMGMESKKMHGGGDEFGFLLDYDDHHENEIGGGNVESLRCQDGKDINLQVSF